MSNTINSSQASVNAYVTQQTSTSQTTAAATTSAGSSAASGTTTANVDTYSLSSMAQELAAQEKSWASMTTAQLQSTYNSTWNSFVQFDAAVNSQGNKVIYADERTTGTPEEIAFSKKVGDYMVSTHSDPPGNVANPYAGASRAMLTSIMYDTSGKYTVSERYAAAGEQETQDFTYLSGLGEAAVRNGTDQRQLYQGLLDYYDAMSPVEKSIVPGGYREQLEGYLQTQEATSGSLSKRDTDSVLQAMLKAFNETSDSTSTLTSKEPISSQLAKIISSQ